MMILFLISVLLIVLFAVLTVFYMNQAYTRVMKRNFDYLTEFPFEGYQIRCTDTHIAIGAFVALILTMVLTAYAPLFASDTVKGFLSARPVLMAVTGTLFPVSLVGFIFIGGERMKLHLANFVTSYGLFVLYCVSAGFLFLDMRAFNAELGLAFAIVYFVLAGLGAIVILNPKLASWGKLKKVGDGESAIYVRPRPFMLPFSEWLLVALGILASVFFIFIFYYLTMNVA